MNLAKSSEFRMLWLVLPSSGATIMARCLKSWYVEEYTNDAIGRGGGGIMGFGKGCSWQSDRDSCTSVLKYC